MMDEEALWTQILKACAKLNEDMLQQPITSKWWKVVAKACWQGGVINWF